MLTIPSTLFLIALIFAAVDLVNSSGKSLTCWAVVLIAVGLLWGVLGR
jgi:hypothetical protein